MTGTVAVFNTASDLQQQVEQFLYHEAALLDAWRLDDWLALMHPDVEYRVPAPVRTISTPGTPSR
ncbi:aromatic-ring-hydroxylating dioxygenase subunit beta [Kutzneria kofuensis]|uniref:aromatic-ring-hydroxylating dioxygenase subunit beta n=1 Tax=Kutzneria kofuensis TaxID=103725 RepID=UPI0031E6DDAF